MDIQVGDHVLVNLAPFIGVVQWCRNSVLCNVLEVDETRVRIVTNPPYREVDLWISANGSKPSWNAVNCRARRDSSYESRGRRARSVDDGGSSTRLLNVKTTLVPHGCRGAGMCRTIYDLAESDWHRQRAGATMVAHRTLDMAGRKRSANWRTAAADRADFCLFNALLALP